MKFLHFSAYRGASFSGLHTLDLEALPPSSKSESSSQAVMDGVKGKFGLGWQKCLGRNIFVGLEQQSNDVLSKADAWSLYIATGANVSEDFEDQIRKKLKLILQQAGIIKARQPLTDKTVSAYGFSNHEGDALLLKNNMATCVRLENELKFFNGEGTHLGGLFAKQFFVWNLDIASQLKTYLSDTFNLQFNQEGIASSALGSTDAFTATGPFSTPAGLKVWERLKK